ncbi:hypothetical protein IWW38_003428 [Coemansia aciculifera]|uniref:Uncharacterized protein n=1 Tax=Coemansia aciculifera TaxID=417176 RepID=A0ACC1M0P1_9FUNG|nr:hypothetical protein IWW38_003428 [Coemansia aciculifera]
MLFKLSTVAAALLATVSAHMAMIEPCTRYTPHNPKCPALPAGASLDYNLKSPLGVDQALCKYTTPYATPVETWTAGQSISVQFDSGGAAHGGGHCEFSLSYDGGKTFVVIHQELQYCFFGAPSGGNSASILSYTFNLPANVPSSNNVVFSWTWVNAIGNREFYMNCADVAIVGGSASSFTGKQMTIANHNGYPTIPEFNGDYTTGLQYYSNSTTITVTGSGSSSGGSNPPVPHVPQPPAVSSAVTSVNQQLPSVVPSPVVPIPSYVPPPPQSSAPSVPVPTSPPAPGACVQGTQLCNANGSGFNVCVWGTWSSTISCPAGTVCKASAPGFVNCGWP